MNLFVYVYCSASVIHDYYCSVFQDKWYKPLDSLRSRGVEVSILASFTADLGLITMHIKS